MESGEANALTPLVLRVAVAFPFIAPLVRILPNHKRDSMNQFFATTIQKIIQQREELPPEQVNVALLFSLEIRLHLAFVHYNCILV